MAKYSQKFLGKEVGQAPVYAEPHTMSGKKLDYRLPTVSGPEYVKSLNVSVGNISKGIPDAPGGKLKTRGTGAATKGLYSSTKMG